MSHYSDNYASVGLIGAHRPNVHGLSSNVQQLQDAVNNLFNERDRLDFIDALNEYRSRRNVHEFVQMMKILLDTPGKKQLIPLLRKVIPHADVGLFEKCVVAEKLGPSRFSSTLPGRNSSTMNAGTQRYQTLPARGYLAAENYNSLKKSAPNFWQNKQQPLSLLGAEDAEIKKIHISTKNGESLGLSIRGGAEHGIGIYVSHVDKGSMAMRQGLVPGDQIIIMNDFPFENITHDEAAKMIKSARKLDLVIKRVGRIPGSYTVHQTYTWVDPDGRAVPPPPEIDKTSRYEARGERKSGLMLLKDSDERKVNVLVDSGSSLGLMIRGGNEFGLGIYITGVDVFSVAEHAGLKVGDQILDVNGCSFLDISHGDAVQVLKSSRHMMMTIKDVGRLPYARTTYDQTRWIPEDRIGKGNGKNIWLNGTMEKKYKDQEPVFTKGAGSQLVYNAKGSQWALVENQAQQLLNEQECGTLRYYLTEYQNEHVNIDSLMLALGELLNTHAKSSLFSEVRTLISAKDLDRFDTLILKRDVDTLKVLQAHQTQSVTYFPDHLSETSFESPLSSSLRSESSHDHDSVYLDDFSLMINSHHQPPHKANIPGPEPLRRTIDQIYDDKDGISEYFGGDKKSVNGHGNSNNRAKKHQVHTPSSEEVVVAAEVHRQSRQPDKLQQRPGNDKKTVDDGCQTEEPSIVNIYKTKPTLGIAIEGGANTNQPLPRIINIQKIVIDKCRSTLGIAITGGSKSREPLPKVVEIEPGGSAHESGGLKVGHVLLEVNGKSLKGLEHKDAAREIAQAFKGRDTDRMELVVLDS